MAKRKRQRMSSRAMRAANRQAIAEHAAELGPSELQRRADVSTLESYSAGLSADPTAIAQAWTDETDDPGWGIDRDACARQYKRLTGSSLTRASARRAIDEAEDSSELRAELNFYRTHPIEGLE